MTVADEKIKTSAKSAVNNLVQSTPHVRRVLERFQWNTGHFLLFMRFVLGCLHRRDHLEQITVTSALEAPYCADRTESPATGAAENAKRSLEELKLWHNQPFILSLVVDPKEVPEFQPGSEVALRVDNNELHRRLRELQGAARMVSDTKWIFASRAMKNLRLVLESQTVKEAAEKK